jgi:hypothetical protein
VGTAQHNVSLEIAVLREATDVIVANHYLHRGRRMAQLPYWVLHAGERVGVMLFALPRLSVSFHGHHPMALIELARLWLDPQVQDRFVVDRRGRRHSLSIASRAIGHAMRRVRTDWATKYPHLPSIEACVAWADLTRHEGTVYKAANFTFVGTSGGRQPGRWNRPGGGEHKRHDDYLARKACFMYSWDSRARGHAKVEDDAA